MRIDVQSHVFPRSYGELFEKYSAFPKTRREGPNLFLDFNGKQMLVMNDFQYAPETLIREMDKGRVDISVISPNIPDPGFLPEERRAEACRLANDEVAAIVSRFPQRFRGLALLPWGQPQEALKELKRAKATGFCGVMLFTHNGGILPDDPALETVYAECERLGLPICLHPTVPLWYEPIGAYGMIASSSFVIDTGFSLMRMIYSGVFLRHPLLRLVMPHAGGVLPYLDGRLSYTPPYLRSKLDKTKPTVVETLRSESVWYDLANPSAEVLNMFRGYMGLERAMYATDYPFVEQEYMTALTEKLGLSIEQSEGIAWKNADRLFGLGL